jgi:hypothetical protein
MFLPISDDDCRILKGRCALDGVPVRHPDGFFWFFLGDEMIVVLRAIFEMPPQMLVVAVACSSVSFRDKVVPSIVVLLLLLSSHLSWVDVMAGRDEYRRSGGIPNTRYCQ